MVGGADHGTFNESARAKGATLNKGLSLIAHFDRAVIYNFDLDVN